MRGRESPQQAATRWDELSLVQQHYKDFLTFLEDAMHELGFVSSEVQQDIAGFVAHGPMYIMVMAQRGQAKTTIVACYVIFCLIHSPAHRTLIISAGGRQAKEISTLIVRLLMSMEVLRCLRPDESAGDLSSVEAFDVHHSLKGLDKTPSVACVGIGSNLQGKRADLLVADDIESAKNAATPLQRDKLLQLTKDFSSICSRGRIIWLGTPQSAGSVYNSLPSRGVVVRIWPGRYPTSAQVARYGTMLAPYLVQRLTAHPHLGMGGGMLSDQGQPLDPKLLNEQDLQAKELDQGTAFFQLQHMLNTELTDAMRHPLKTQQLVAVRGAGNLYPVSIIRGMTQDRLKDFTSGDHSFQMMTPHEVSTEALPLQKIWAYIDPAAGGTTSQDETAWAIGGFITGKVVLLSCGGVPGGYDEEKLQFLANQMAKFNTNGFKLDGIRIEKNMGYGAFKAIWLPFIRAAGMLCQVDDDLVSGQKEMRIINTLGPVLGRGALIVDEAVVAEDSATIQRYDAQGRTAYSLFYQMANLTVTRNALRHDDRVDAVEGLVRIFVESLAQDQKRNLETQRARTYQESIRDPLGYSRYTSRVAAPNLLRHRRG
jgi:hypothetical protein